ncbi:MAG: GNAT family N-acetyltransferase [Bacteroides sp.]|jgi:hypothetical protein|nr:GNAT family N-acetyltransferase [Bacteroides sp.]
MEKISIIGVDANNLSQYPDVVCFINPKHPSFPHKTEWLKQRFSEGLQIKLLFVEGQKKAAGLIEYVPGQFAWRAVSAEGYLFIHCIFLYPNNNKGKGYGSLLVESCLEDARESNALGLAVITSKGSFMAESRLFLKNGFELLEEDGAGNQLLVRPLKEGPLPHLNDWKARQADFQGLHILYSRQCPWVARLIDEIREEGLEDKLKMQIKELTVPSEAQQAPSSYAVFNLLHNGRLLADRYVSVTRLKNILEKEKLL